MPKPVLCNFRHSQRIHMLIIDDITVKYVTAITIKYVLGARTRGSD